jgi:hypothetical protein
MPATVCRACGTPLSIDEPIPRDAECPHCAHDVRACANCRHYDPRLHNACRETEAEPVEDRHHRNFCEYFELSREPWTAGSGDRAGAARAKLDQLFGGTGRSASSGSARDKLEGLFKKRPPDEN